MDARALKIRLLPVMVFGILAVVIAVMIWLMHTLGIGSLHSEFPGVPRVGWMIAGIILVVASAPFFVGAIRTLGRETSAGFGSSLVSRSVYGYTRNPMYFGLHVTVIGIGLILNSMGVVVAGVFAVIVGIITAKREEPKLLEQYGEPYRAYRRNTPFYVPDYFRLLRDTRSGSNMRSKTP